MSKTRHVTIKSAFDLIDGHRWDEDHPKWKVVWKWRGPEKVKTFLWLVMNDKLLTNMEHVRRHMTNIVMRGRCHVDSEIALHVLRDCPFSTQIWLGLVPQERWLEFFSFSLQDWLCWNLSNYSSYDLSLNWSLIFGVAC